MSAESITEMAAELHVLLREIKTEMDDMKIVDFGESSGLCDTQDALVSDVVDSMARLRRRAAHLHTRLVRWRKERDQEVKE